MYNTYIQIYVDTNVIWYIPKHVYLSTSWHRIADMHEGGFVVHCEFIQIYLNAHGTFICECLIYGGKVGKISGQRMRVWWG